MTREDAIKMLKSKMDGHTDTSYEWVETVRMAIKALEQEPITIYEIPKDYRYDTETEDFLVYRHKYTGDEIHIERPVPLYRLEQEPFINKPCVSEKVCEHDKQMVLDKIRTEIEQKARIEEIGGRGNGKSIRYGLCMALEIIDKYKAIQTGTEGSE